MARKKESNKTLKQNQQKIKEIRIECNTSMDSARNKTVMLHRRRHAWFCHVFPAKRMLFYIGIVFSLILNYCVNDSVAFNLENRLPIVKYGAGDTYFGYSVAGHIVDESDDKPAEKW